MNQPGDDRDRGTAPRVTGVGLGLPGATFGGVAGWFTLHSGVPRTPCRNGPSRLLHVGAVVQATGRPG
jgi:hypothetical protein